MTRILAVQPNEREERFREVATGAFPSAATRLKFES